MKILSYHPFSLYANGGGSRILRRLYEGHELEIKPLVVEGVSLSVPKGEIDEIVVFASPVTRWWMRWKVRNLAIWLRHHGLKFITLEKVRKAARKVDYDVLHVINHGAFSAALCADEFLKGKQLWVSFHDHFSTTHSSFEDARQLWIRAGRRLVISEEIAAEYTRLFGPGEYELITDGVTLAEIKPPKNAAGKPIMIYFAGLLHLEYMPLFRILADALDKLATQDYAFKLVLRGTQQLNFLEGRTFETEYRPLTLNNEALKQELDEADILYLPIKFTVPDFYRYSLSTKMVGYLAAPGVILYHGPADSAACHLLEQHKAAVSCTSLNADDLLKKLKLVQNGGGDISTNAKMLAKQRFDLAQTRLHFWQES